MALFPKVISMEFKSEDGEPPEFLGPGGAVHGIHATHPVYEFVIELDGKQVLSIPNVRAFSVTDSLPKLGERLGLLEKILSAADAFGTAVVVREPGGTYSVPRAEDIRFTVVDDG